METMQLKNIVLSTSMMTSKQISDYTENTFIHKTGTLDQGMINLSGMYRQAPDIYTNAYGRNSFVAAETILKSDGITEKYQKSSAGTKGWIIIGVDKTNHTLKLKGDVSSLNTDSILNKVIFSVAIYNKSIPEFTTITSVNTETGIITLQNWNTLLDEFDGKSQAYFEELYKTDDNGFFAMSDSTLGATELYNFCGCHAEGGSVKAVGKYTHAEGRRTIAGHRYAHAEGDGSFAYGQASHAEGDGSKAYGYYSHAEGYRSYTKGESSHAESNAVSAIGNYSHAEGSLTIAKGVNSHSEGNKTYADGSQSHSEGNQVSAIGSQSHAEGNATYAIGESSHAEGSGSKAFGARSHAEGYYTMADNESSHAEGYQVSAVGNYSHASGYKTYAKGNYSVTYGQECSAIYDNSIACGKYAIANSNRTLALGYFTNAKDERSFVWSGVKPSQEDSSHLSNYYESNYSGSFNINSLYGIAGFFIGKDNFTTCIIKAIQGMDPSQKSAIKKALDL